MFEAFAAETGANGADPGIFASTTTWVAVAFVIVVGFVWVKAKGKVVGALDGRAERIRARLDEARTLREEAQALLAEYEHKQKEALRTADEIVEHARTEADRMRRQAREDLEEAIARREKQAEERIAQAEAQAVREVRGEIVDVAIAAARRLVAERLDQGRQSALIDAAIDDLPARLH